MNLYFKNNLYIFYNYKSYQYSKHNYQIPLGYSKNFLTSPSLQIEPPKINERIINASFIGGLKSDRIHMSNVFRSNIKNTHIAFVNNNWDIDNMPYSPKKCYEIYSQSKFVIIGRGNTSLDCFRIYEAVVAGAIPVIVGSIEEINITFQYNNVPPFIYANSWENAANLCKYLLKEPEKLQQIQNNTLMWWKNIILSINELIVNVVSAVE